MQGLTDFLLSLLDYSVLLALSLVLGGVVWGLYVLRPWRHLTDERGVVSRCVSLLFAGTICLALAQPMEVGITAWFLGQTLQQSPFPAFLHTPQFQAGMSRALIAAALVVAVAWLRRRPEAARRWAVVALLAVGLAASGAWLTHAVERFDDRVQLMVLTALHEVGGAVWLGGLAQLGAVWHLTRRRRDLSGLWPALLSRFSKVAMASVLLLVTTGSAVAWPYIGNWKNLIGTNYGLYLILKMMLLAAALGFAALNFRAVRRWRKTHRDDEALRTRVPYFIEAETLLALAIVLLASVLLALPLAVDEEAANQRATWSEVAGIITPKWPVLTSPSHMETVAAADPFSPVGSAAHDAGNGWSEFNHDIAGLCLVALSVLALAAWTQRLPGVRHWPLGFVALAVFVIVRGDPTTWPLGHIGFWQGTLGRAEVLEHRLAAVLTLALGLIDWRARTAGEPRRWLAYVFPVLCIAGGMMLFIHFHSAYSDKYVFFLSASHAPAGVLGVAVGCGRWLELRLDSRAGRWAGLASILAMFLFGLMMAFYRETLGA